MTKSRNSASLSSIKALDKDALRVLASDISADILSACLSNGGHLSSNLGAVELTISLVKNFDLKEDDILFDVGHQAYSYKILTGRNIRDIRITNGISPFNFISPMMHTNSWLLPIDAAGKIILLSFFRAR